MADEFVNVDCIGMIGKMPTPEGECMFWDTGKTITPEQLKKIKTLQWQGCYGTRHEQKSAFNKLRTFTEEVTKEQNVYPPKYAGMTDDCRIVVNTPWFKSKVETATPPSK